MKIWMDILTGKQLLFAEPIIRKMRRGNTILCTTRDYRELNSLVKIRKMQVRTVGSHGGRENLSKLLCGTKRIELLSGIVSKFLPDVAISFQSPEAARVAFGLGIKHVGFSDSPHATAVMKLTVPYLDRLLIPWVLDKSEFAAYGIPEGNILQYRAIDAAITVQRSHTVRYRRGVDDRVIMIRMAESHASYNDFADSQIVPIIDRLLERLPDYTIHVLPRYADQIRFLKRQYRRRITIQEQGYNAKDMLALASVFLGSGGTMTAEAAFFGIPTISYSTRPDYHIDAFLEKKGIIARESDPEKIAKRIKEFEDGKSHSGGPAAALLRQMRDVMPVLRKAMGS